MRRLAPALLVFAAVLIGCGDDTAIREAPRSLEYFARARDFVAAASVLLNESRQLWGQSIRALYYAGLTVARAKDLDGFAADDSSIHEEVWQQTVKGARPFFRDVLRRMRNRWDYEVRDSMLPTVEEELKVIVREGPDAFAVLFEDARAAVQRQHRRCSMDERMLCNRCRGLAVPGCLRSAALQELSELESDVEKYIATAQRKVEEN
jgi:hypothetical protein